ncbi:MAG: hypothetical protein LBQ86_05445 [Holophagales bacterium]|jgi:tRNA pseudouridine38-40 synthase|nr:hypothetical protein [Holophagales bacterium]
MTSTKKQPSTSFRLLIEYDGRRYHGWQRQGTLAKPYPQHGTLAKPYPQQGAAQSATGVKTIAGAIDRVLHLAGVKILNLTGAGRTDSGVHALGQVAHIHLAHPIKSFELHQILEQGLPYDIAVPHIEPCPPDFDARHDAISRTYLYQIALRKSAFTKNHTWWPKAPLDLPLLNETWSLFEGNHSMAAFADLEAGENPRCQIYDCHSKTSGHILLLRVTARFFLRRQVRRMVGAVVQCAAGNVEIDRIAGDIKAPSKKSALYWAEKTAPASGLFLESVGYGSEHDSVSRAVQF